MFIPTRPLLFTIKSFAVFKIPNEAVEADEPLSVPLALSFKLSASIINGDLAAIWLVLMLSAITWPKEPVETAEPLILLPVPVITNLLVLPPTMLVLPTALRKFISDAVLATKFLASIDPLDVPDNLTSFYYTNVTIEKNLEKNIKFNNDIIHQSKLINYFNGDYAKSKIEKDINNFLKKIKKNKNYFLSKKDIIFLESLKSDGIQISKKFDDLYEINDSEIPTDIQVMINNNEAGTALLRIVEVIGQDELEKIDEDTIYFIIATLNQLDIDFIRNKILLKVLPLKV